MKISLKDISIDFLGKLIFPHIAKTDLRRFRQVRRIAFINIGGLGDYLLFSPIIKIFRAEYPDAHITLMTGPNFNGISELFPELDEVVLLQPRVKTFLNLLRCLRRGRYDVLIVNHDFEIPLWKLSLAIGFSGIPIRVGCHRNGLRDSALTSSVDNQNGNADGYLMDIFSRLATEFFRQVNKPVNIDPMNHFRYVPTPEELGRLDTLLAPYPAQSAHPAILIHPGTSQSSKTENWKKSWPSQAWRQCMHNLIQRYPGALVYLTGGPDDADEIQAIDDALKTLPPEGQARIINLYGKIPSVACLAALMKRCDVFIGCDSFAMHLALFVGTPLVAIFGLTNEKRFLPANHETCRVAARDDLACRPCLQITRTESCNQPVCLDVPVETVVSHVENLLRDVNVGLGVR